MSESRTIKIFDTTLRDGEQSPGASMNLAEKMELAQALVDFGGGRDRGRLSRSLRPAISRRSAQIAEAVRGTTICGLARCERHRHRSRVGGAQARRASADPRVSGHQRHPSGVQAEDGSSEEIIRRAVAGVRRAGELLRRRRVLAGRRRPHRAGFSLPGGRGGDRSRRHHGEYSRHGRLCHAGAHGRRDSQPRESRAEHRSGGDQHALPQRSGAGRGEQPGWRRERSRPDRMHDQRHRRAGWQLLARGSGDGAAHAQRLLPLPTRGINTRAARANQPAGFERSPAFRCSATRRSSAATPSPTRPASIRTACSRSARLTRSCAPRMSASPRPISCSASTAAGRRWPTAPERSAIILPASNCKRCSSNSRRWPTRRRKFTTATSPRSDRARVARRMPEAWRFVSYEIASGTGMTPHVRSRCNYGTATDEVTRADVLRRRAGRCDLPGDRKNHRRRTWSAAISAFKRSPWARTRKAK